MIAPLQRGLLVLFAAAIVGVAVPTVFVPSPVQAAVTCTDGSTAEDLDTCPKPTSGDCSQSNFFAFPRWCKYLPREYYDTAYQEYKKGEDLNLFEQSNARKLWLIGAAILDMLLYAGGIAAFVFILVASFRLIVSSGDPGGQGRPSAIAAMRMSVVNALIGLVIIVIARGIVAFIAGVFNNEGSSDPKINGTENRLVWIGPRVTGSDSAVQTALELFFAAIGVISVVMIIIGGIKYITSSGDPGSTNTAKNTILYAVIGLAFAIISLTIVNFVLERFI